jgi:hypothetical protein
VPDPDKLEPMFTRLAGMPVRVPPLAAVVARGRRRKIRIRAASACAVIVLAAAVGVQLPRLGSQQPAPARAAAGLCRAAPPSAAVRAALTTPVPVTVRNLVTPLGITPDGRVAYVQIQSPAFTGVAGINLRTSAIVSRIQRISYGLHVVGGYAGHFLVWTSEALDISPAYNPVREWSATTGAVRVLQVKGLGGWVESVPALNAKGTLAAWEQWQSSPQHAEIVEANLSTGQAEVIARGAVSAPFFYGHLLVWRQSPTAFSWPRSLAARNASVFPATRPAVVPPALAGAGDASLIVAHANAAAYLSPDRRTLYYSARPGQRARPLVRFRLEVLLPPAVGAGYLALGWPGSLISTVSHADLSGHWDEAVGTGNYVWFGWRFFKSYALFLIKGAAIAKLTCAAGK